MIIGIDNALKGGISAISRSHGSLIAMAPMPTLTRRHIFEKTKRRKRKGKIVKERDIATSSEIDGRKVVEWIKATTDSRPCTIAIEECPEHAAQKSAMRSMAISYGILIGALGAGLPDYKLVIVRSGNPKDSWQRKMLGDYEQGETKAAALAAAARLWPGETFIATPRCTTPHDGMVDASLIAEFTRISNL